MGRRGIRTFVVAAALLALPASASAAWTPADTISPSGASTYGPQVAVDNAGNSANVWVRASDGAVQARRRAADGSLGPTRTLSPGGAYGAHVAISGGGRGHVVWSDGLGDVVVRSWSPGGSVGPLEQVSAIGAITGNSAVAEDSSGNAIVVWEQFDGAHWRVMSGRRSPA